MAAILTSLCKHPLPMAFHYIITYLDQGYVTEAIVISILFSKCISLKQDVC